jgi:hypothetical protein
LIAKKPLKLSFIAQQQPQEDLEQQAEMVTGKAFHPATEDGTAILPKYRPAG